MSPEKDPSLKRVIFLPENKVVWVLEGTSIFQAALKADIPLTSPCGGKGTCGKCKVKLEPPPSVLPLEREKLTPEEIETGWRLACQHTVERDTQVEIPPSSRYYEQRIVSRIDKEKIPLLPPLRKITLSLPGKLEGVQSILERFNIEPSRIDLYSLQKISSLLREKRQLCLVENEQGKITIFSSRYLFGIAFDIGTTTLVAYLVDLEEGGVKDICAVTNPQRVFGEDVITRIEYALKGDKERKKIQDALREGMNECIRTLMGRNGLKEEDIWEVSIAGNTAMMHFLLGIDPYFLSRTPFISLWRGALYLSPEELKLRMQKRGRVYILPLISSFVGGDTAGLILSTGIYESSGVKVAVDIGTNGEVILSLDGKITVTSTAAGPAFEGARISQGMRAEGGAIDSVRIDEEGIHIGTVGNLPSRGICGTGLVDAVAELLRWGVIDPTGYLKGAKELAGIVPSFLSERAREGEFYLTPRVKITQRDVRELQLAKSAIRTGIKILLEERGLQEGDIEELILAGGFGSYLRKESAVRIGLIPPLDIHRIKVVGNAAGAGSYMVLVNRCCREKIEEVVRKVEHLELGNNRKFQDEFSRNIFFPEGGEVSTGMKGYSSG